MVLLLASNTVFADNNFSGFFSVSEKPAAVIDAKNQWQSTTRFNPKRDEPLMIKTTTYNAHTNVDMVLTYPDSSEYVLRSKLSLKAETESTFGFAGRVNNAYVPPGAYRITIRYNNNLSRDYDDHFYFSIYYAPEDINTPVPQYTITFNSTGGTAVSSITQPAGAAVNPPASPTRSGYTFSHWIPSIPSTMPANHLTLTAQWSAIPSPTPNPEEVSGGLYWYSKLQPQGHEGDYLTNPKLNWNDKTLNRLKIEGYTYPTTILRKTDPVEEKINLLTEWGVMRKWGCYVTAYANILRNLGAVTVNEHIDFREGINSKPKRLIPDPFTVTMANIAQKVSDRTDSGWPKIYDNKNGWFSIKGYTGGTDSSVTWFTTALEHFKDPKTNKKYTADQTSRGSEPLQGYLSAMASVMREHPEGIAVNLYRPSYINSEGKEIKANNHMVVFQKYAPDFLNYIATGNPNGLDPTRGVTWIEESKNPLKQPITIEPIPVNPIERFSVGSTTDDAPSESLSYLNQYNWSLLNYRESDTAIQIDETAEDSSFDGSSTLNQNQTQSDPMEAYIFVQENATKNHEEGYNVGFDKTWSYNNAGHRLKHIIKYAYLYLE